MFKVFYLSIILISTLSFTFGVAKNRDVVKLTEVWNRSDISNTQIKLIPSQFKNKSSFPMNVVINKDSKWSEEDVLLMIRRAEVIFNNCGISISPIRLVWLNHPSLNSLKCNNDFIFTDDIPVEIERPVAIFVQKNYCTRYGYSNWLSDFKSEPEHDFEVISAGTVFLSYEVQPVREVYPKLFGGLLAHELAHVFTEEGHNDIDQNILSHEDKKAGYAITTGENSQCEKVINHPYINNKNTNPYIR